MPSHGRFGLVVGWKVIAMAEPWLKRQMQRLVGAAGYKIVQLKAYERRNGKSPTFDASANKIFGIGYNKTASTTLEAILRHYGFRLPKQLEQEQALAGVPFNGDFSKLRDFIAEYDAFQDVPFSQFDTYIACDVLYPGSKFILTIRDPDHWFASYVRYYRKAYGFTPEEELNEASFLGKDLYLFPGYVHGLMRHSLLVANDQNCVAPDWSKVFDPTHFKALYMQRNTAIVRYFSNRPQDLLVIDLSKEVDTSRIVAFLGLTKEKIIPVPHLNIG